MPLIWWHEFSRSDLDRIPSGHSSQVVSLEPAHRWKRIGQSRRFRGQVYHTSPNLATVERLARKARPKVIGRELFYYASRLGLDMAQRAGSWLMRASHMAYER